MRVIEVAIQISQLLETCYGLEMKLRNLYKTGFCLRASQRLEAARLHQVGKLPSIFRHRSPPKTAAFTVSKAFSSTNLGWYFAKDLFLTPTTTINAADFHPVGPHKILWAYWRELQQNTLGDIPLRSEFNPAKVKAILSQIGISEYVDRDTQIIRLLGGNHQGIWPDLLVGTNLFDYLDKKAATERREIYQELMHRPCACFLETELRDIRGAVTDLTGMMLPCLNKEGSPTIIIGTYMFHADPIEVGQLSDTGLVGRKNNRRTYINFT